LVGLGKAIRAYREASDLSQEALAHACQLDRTYIGGVERGERNLGIINLWRIADALGVHAADFLKSDKKS